MLKALMINRNGTGTDQARESDSSINDDKNNDKSKDDGISGNIVPYKSSFIPSSLAWIGGSLFSSLQSNDVKFINFKILMEQCQSKVAQNTPSRGDKMSTKLVEEKGGNAIKRNRITIEL